MTTLYRNGRIFDGERMIDGHAVLVEDGRIRRVAPQSEFDGFAGDEVDCSEGTLLPGLIDCHVHLLFRGEPDPMTVLDKLDAAHAVVRALEHAADTLRGGITSVRDCGGREYQEFAVRDACNEGRFPGPTVRAAGKMICMTGGHGNRVGRVADGPDEVVKAVREQVHAGCDHIAIFAVSKYSIGRRVGSLEASKRLVEFARVTSPDAPRLTAYCDCRTRTKRHSNAQKSGVGRGPSHRHGSHRLGPGRVRPASWRPLSRGSCAALRILEPAPTP